MFPILLEPHRWCNGLRACRPQVRYRADPRFQVRGAHFKKLCRAEGGAKMVGVFRVKNHDFTPTIHIFSNFRGGGGRRVRPPPPWIRLCGRSWLQPRSGQTKYYKIRIFCFSVMYAANENVRCTQPYRWFDD